MDDDTQHHPALHGWVLDVDQSRKMHVDVGGHRVHIGLDIVLVAWHPAVDGLEYGADTLIADARHAVFAA